MVGSVNPVMPMASRARISGKISDWRAAGNFIGFSGLGVYGGSITGTLAAYVYLRRHRESFWMWADIVAPGRFAMQAVARWGNFFNQELYGSPTNLPWGIAIDCEHRVADLFRFEASRRELP